MILQAPRAPAVRGLRTSFRIPFVASAPTDQVSGASVLAFVNAYGYFRRQPLQMLAARGIEAPRADCWYPFQAYLDVQAEVYRTVGANTLARVGRKLVEGANLPPTLNRVHDALAGLDADYRARHRCSDSGGFTYEVVDDTRGVMVVSNPYPCELDHAVVESLARRMQPDGAVWARVRHLPGGCRKEGAEECTLEVTF